jgi:hypothetical protein
MTSVSLFSNKEIEVSVHVPQSRPALSINLERRDEKDGSHGVSQRGEAAAKGERGSGPFTVGLSSTGCSVAGVLQRLPE